MWQRIQTLYLAVSTVLLFILFFSDAYTVTAPDGMQYVTYLQLQKPYFAILLGILFAMTVLALITFKVRILQMRLATLSGLVALGMTGWLAYFYFTARRMSLSNGPSSSRSSPPSATSSPRAAVSRTS